MPSMAAIAADVGASKFARLLPRNPFVSLGAVIPLGALPLPGVEALELYG